MKKNMISLEPRQKKMNKIFGKESPDKNCELLKSLSITEVDRKKVFYALMNVVYNCLINNDKNKLYELRADFFDIYADDILKLPNITPNGLVLPKAENICAYNQLISTVNDAFSKTGIGKYIDKVQLPINIRLQTGFPRKDEDSRGRASTKIHTDIWAGDPTNSILSFLALVGDPTKISGIDFFRMDSFPKKFMRLIDNYDDGKVLADSMEKIDASFDSRGWFFADSYLMHQTTKNFGKGFRISIDFRFIPSLKCKSDYSPFLIEEKKKFFIKYAKFKEIGKTIFLHTDEKMHDGFVKKDYTAGYPVKLKFK